MRSVRFVTPNYPSIVARVVFLGLYGLLMGYWFRDGILYPPEAKVSVAEHYLAYGVFALPVLVVVGSLLGVTGIAYSEKDRTFELRRLIVLRTTYRLEDLKGFRRTFQVSSYGEKRHGCRLKFHGRLPVTLIPYNLTRQGLDEFKAFLLRSGVSPL